MGDKSKSKFGELLKELQDVDATLAKAMPAAKAGEKDDDNEDDDEAGTGGKDDGKDEGGDAKIQAAADDADGDGKKSKGGKDMCKSFTVEDASGEKHEVIDASELLASMQGEQETLGKAQKLTGQVLGKLSSAFQTMAKSLGTLTEQNEKLVKQNEELQKSLNALGDKGRGRKSVVVAQGGDDGQGQGKGDGMKPEEFMAKCDVAIEKGRISAIEASTIEGYLNRGQQPPENLVAKVLAAA